MEIQQEAGAWGWEVWPQKESLFNQLLTSYNLDSLHGFHAPLLQTWYFYSTHLTLKFLA